MLEVVPQVCIHCVAEGECVQVRLRGQTSYKQHQYLPMHCRQNIQAASGDM